MGTWRVLLECWDWVIALGKVAGNRIRRVRCGIPSWEGSIGGWGDLMLFPHRGWARGALGWSVCDSIRGLVVHLPDLGGLRDCSLIVLVWHGSSWRVLRGGVAFLVPGRRVRWRVVWSWRLGVGSQRMCMLEG